MKRVFHNFAGRWSVIVWVVFSCQSVSLVQDAGADDGAKSSKTRAEASSRSAKFDSGGEEAGHASAITRREGGDGSRIVQVIEDDKMIRIAVRPGKGVTVIVVETVRDSEKVNRYAAPNLETLKSRHPRGFEFYQRYANADPLVAEAKGDATAEAKGMAEAMGDAKEALNPTEKQLALEARMRAQMLQKQQLQQMQQMLQRQQQFQQQAGSQQGGVFRGAWASSSARAQASASSSASSSSSKSQRSSNGGR